jgi:hypothetical protein
MADQDSAKHHKNVFSLVPPKEPNPWHKARDIAQDILIIVVAVSISLWLYSVGTHRHEQQQVKTFLLGLKRDLQGDLVQINEVVAANRTLDTNYAYLAELGPDDAPSKARLDAALALAYSNTFFTPQLSRYDSFKSSAKLNNIDNDALLERIGDLYQQHLPQLRHAESAWGKGQRDIVAYLDDGADAANGADPRLHLLAAPKGRRLLANMAQLKQRYERYQSYATLGQLIIRDIEQAYPEARYAAAR